jgi:hypothetical protein
MDTVSVTREIVIPEVRKTEEVVLKIPEVHFGGEAVSLCNLVHLTGAYFKCGILNCHDCFFHHIEVIKE